MVLVTYNQLKLKSYNWMNRNKKPSSRAQVFYFIYSWFLHVLPPKVWFVKLI
jgi:hypothetical protein